MSGKEFDHPEMAKFDPVFTEMATNLVAPVIKRWFRSEVRGLDSFPPAGGALVVGNHSGGVLTPDVLVFAPAFYDKFGYDRPLYTLAHYGVFITPFAGYLGRLGVIHASRRNAAKALHSGAVVLVFPGGDYERFDQRWPRTSSTSTVAPDTSGPRLRRAYRSCLRCRSGGRKPSCS